MIRRFFIFYIISFFILSIATAEDRRVNQNILTIMSLNAEFLWDGVEPEEGSVDFEWKGSQTEAEEHMREIANIIIASNPDIVSLVEVENKSALETLNNKYFQGRGYKPYFIKGRDTYTGQDMALLTRIDPEGNSIEYDDRLGTSGNTSKKVSKNYIARFDLNGTKIAMIGLHFLSRPLDSKRRFDRQAQADAIRLMAMENRIAGYEVVVLGDFNDFDGDFCCLDHIGSSPITTVLSAIKKMDPSSAFDDLTNVTAFIPKELRYTAFYDRDEDNNIDAPGEYTAIDHILLSEGLAKKIDFADIPHNHDPRLVTDHFPVVVRIKFGSSSSDNANATLWIISLLPNPAGNENQNEQITVKNMGSNPIDLAGWTVKDMAGRIWKLDGAGTIQPNQEKEIKRAGQAMALNNGGDTVDLINPDGISVQTITYSRVSEGEVVYSNCN